MDLQTTGFDDDARVVVQQHGNEHWIVWESFSYRASKDTYTIPRGMCTDFASVPRPVVWYLPRYGPYTLAAILHDHLWRELAANALLPYSDADGIFRRAMRELDVPFFHRWVMWAAVRWAALVKPGGREGWSCDAPAVLLVTLLALPILAVPVLTVLVALVQLQLLELVLWVPLKLNQWLVRFRGAVPAKKVVFPRLELRLSGRAGECPPPGWDRPLRP
ncbi:MAG: DUF1353 domain-containing protein [Actinobacteria bacterium]|nr:DUF1353 domain-containing protein [Actinomycetota bacterium]